MHYMCVADSWGRLRSRYVSEILICSCYIQFICVKIYIRIIMSHFFSDLYKSNYNIEDRLFSNRLTNVTHLRNIEINHIKSFKYWASPAVINALVGHMTSISTDSWSITTFLNTISMLSKLSSLSYTWTRTFVSYNLRKNCV